MSVRHDGKKTKAPAVLERRSVSTLRLFYYSSRRIVTRMSTLEVLKAAAFLKRAAVRKQAVGRSNDQLHEKSIVATMNMLSNFGKYAASCGLSNNELVYFVSSR